MIHRFYAFSLFMIAAQAVLVLSQVPAAAEDILDKKKSRLETVTEEIKSHKKKLDRVKKQEADVISTLNKIEKQLSKENREYGKINERIRSMQKRIKKTHADIDRLSNQLQDKESHLAARLTSLYKYYRRSGLRILLSADSYNEFLKHERYLSVLVSQDHQLFKTSREKLLERKKQQDELNRQKNQLLKDKKYLALKRDEVRSSRRKKISYLEKIKREKSMQVKALRELERYSRELQSFIDTLPAETQRYRTHGKKFSRLRGMLPFPVPGKILSRFGRREHPKLHTFTFQKGIEIQASKGTPIQAVHDGRVVFADWFKGYGYMIIIDHGESYYSLSAHASSLLKKVDDIVSAGETIALVGDTNSIKGECLYFEIRHHGKPQDPLKWLKRG